MLQEPYPELDDLLEMMGEAVYHLAEIGAIFESTFIALATGDDYQSTRRNWLHALP